MIKVYKNTEKIPDCLEKGKAYNCEGVKKELAAIYNNKCCYCETKLTKNFEIEHFRPKEKYRWLEKSWSNLLFVCSSCNKSKSNKFETSNGNLFESQENIDVHKSAAFLNETEKPFFLHPEYDEIENFFAFEKGGKIISKENNERADYTIKHTNLNQAELIKARYEIIENFRKQSNNQLDKADLKKNITEFTKKAYDSKSEFSAFRKYIVKNCLKDILNDILINSK